MIKVKSFIEQLGLTVLVPATTDEMDIRSGDINRPGIQLSGYYDFFAYERPQVFGKVEITYIEQLDEATLHDRLEKLFSYTMPCIICCRGMMPPQILLDFARQRNVPVFLTKLLTTHFMYNLINYLNNQTAPRVTRHGVLVDVYGMGILLTGESGVGKSEAALELIKRGHQLVADDVVDIIRVSDNRLIGECPEMVRNFMEIRGIGIIDIRAMYGISAVTPSKTIDLVLHLEKWIEGKEYDRLGLTDDTISILGVKVAHQLTPVRPGRDLAIIIEVAARDLSLKRSGYSAARELDRRMNELIMNGGK